MPGFNFFFHGDSMDIFEEAIRNNEERIKRKTNLLIIDHNTFRYHTYDMLSVLLLARKKLLPLIKDWFHPFFQLETPAERARFLEVNMANLDFSEVFNAMEPDPATYIKNFSNFTRCEYESDESGRKHITMTQLWGNLSPALERGDINIFVLRDTHETYNMRLPSKTRYFKTDNLWDLATIRQLMSDFDINAVLLDSIEIAARLSVNTKDTSYIFGTHRYNYAVDNKTSTKIYRKFDLLAQSENKLHNEFGMFDPFPLVDDGQPKESD